MTAWLESAMVRVMFFSASTTHALRAAAWLAANGGGGEAILGRDLARELKIPPDYLSKVLATLARSGVLKAARGANGGYRLARAPERIRLVQVVAPFEGSRVRSACLLRPDRPCRGSAACSAHSSWGDVNDAYREFLDKTTLADIREDARKGAKHGTVRKQR
jgi:Rrf2 family iron-sulfur cluster assembly transcriptional regulator